MITRSGKVLKLRWGRIGTDGQTQDKTFASPAAAEKEHDKLVASKRKKGYAEAASAPSSLNGTSAASAAERRPCRDEDLMILSRIAEAGVGAKSDLSHRARAMKAIKPRLLAYLQTV